MKSFCCIHDDMNNMVDSTSTPQTISFLDLLSTCADACNRGCQVIRNVQSKRLNQSSATNGSDNHDSVHDSNDSTSQDIMITYKVENDPRSALTEADIASQKVIVSCLKSVWGDDLKIIGEEDDDDDKDKDGIEVVTENVNNKKPKLNQQDSTTNTDESILNTSNSDPFGTYGISTPLDEPVKTGTFSNYHGDIDLAKNLVVPIANITLYIDPMDGTREFVEQRLQNVQCLIGIVYNGEPVGGVIGLPFATSSSSANDEESSSSTTHMICSLKMNDFTLLEYVTVGKTNLHREEKVEVPFDKLGYLRRGSEATANDENTHYIIDVFSGDSNKIPRKRAIHHLNELISNSSKKDVSVKMNVVGGCGNKILRATALACCCSNRNSLVITPPGNCSWDTAAPTAILFAAAEKFGIPYSATDLYGGSIGYDPSGKNIYNKKGIIISIGEKAVEYHKLVCEAMRNDPELK